MPNQQAAQNYGNAEKSCDKLRWKLSTEKAPNTGHREVDTMETTRRHDVLCQFLYTEGKGRRLLREKENQTSGKEVMHQMNSTGVYGKKAYEALATREHATLKSIAEAHLLGFGTSFLFLFHSRSSFM